MFEPRIVCFFCRWCTYAGADLAGTSRKQYPPNGVVVRVNCSGRIDPQHILWAFREGADAVLIGGCHPGDCHYQDGNMKTMRRIVFLKRLLDAMGIEPERLRLEWISAAEGEKLVRVMSEFVATVKKLGPLDLGLTRGPERERPRTTFRRPIAPVAKAGKRTPAPKVRAKAPRTRPTKSSAMIAKKIAKKKARKAPATARARAKAKPIAKKPTRRK
jgi:F420-non-reducing hydrogenase iron-sulfur subunit